MKRPIWTIFAVTVVLALSAVLYLHHMSGTRLKKEYAAPEADLPRLIGWREDFAEVTDSMLPEGWRLRGKPGTPVADFRIEKGPDGGYGVLYAVSDSSTGSLITQARDVDLRETPFLNWRWRVDKLPEGADGRDRGKDDQAIGIYAGDGSLLNNKSISYRWDTETPRGARGSSVYGAGTVKVRWITLRNRKDNTGEWFTESRNLLEEFEEAWGSVPRNVYISVSANSQYTGTGSAARLEWIELSSAPLNR